MSLHVHNRRNWTFSLLVYSWEVGHLQERHHQDIGKANPARSGRSEKWQCMISPMLSMNLNWQSELAKPGSPRKGIMERSKYANLTLGPRVSQCLTYGFLFPNRCHKAFFVMERTAIRSRRNPKDAGDLTSIHELISDIDRNVHPGLLDIVKNCTYIGVADETFVLLQHNTHLYLMNVINVSKELMYQQVIRRFGYFNAIQLSDPAPIPELLMMALKEEDFESVGDEDDNLKRKIAEMNTGLLKEKAELLDDYFCIHIDQENNLIRLPVVLEQYTPDMDHVPEFLLSLGNDVNWENEKECFQTIAAAIGNFYAMQPPVLPNPLGKGIQFYKKNRGQSESSSQVGKKSTDPDDVGADDIDIDLLAEAENAWAQREWTIQHVLFPAMRLFLKPPNAMATNGTFVEVASLEKLYKIFERC